MPLFRREKPAPQLPSEVPFPAIDHGYDHYVAFMEARPACDRAVAAEKKIAGRPGAEAVLEALTKSLPAVYALARQQEAIDRMLIQASAGQLKSTLKVEHLIYSSDVNTYQYTDYNAVIADQHAAVAYAEKRESPEREWFLDLLALRGAMMSALHDASAQVVRIADKALWLVSVEQAGSIDAALQDVDTTLAFTAVEEAEGSAIALAASWSGRDPAALSDPSQLALMERWHTIYDDSLLKGLEPDQALALADTPIDERPKGLVERARPLLGELSVGEAASVQAEEVAAEIER